MITTAEMIANKFKGKLKGKGKGKSKVISIPN
jgi:hypothetical protein